MLSTLSAIATAVNWGEVARGLGIIALAVLDALI
jgi:hypothetical protein